MYWAFYDSQADRELDWRGRTALESGQLHADKRSAPRTAEQLLFLLEDVNAVERDRPAPLAH
jgi:hypothetical protein